jgi:hypothetical protein
MSAKAGVLLPSLAAILLAAVGGHAAAAGGEASLPVSSDTPATIHFRRILAPADRIKDWPLRDGKYLPVDAAEFERLVAAAQSHDAGRPAAPAAALRATRYEAKLVDDHLIGQTSAEVVLAGPAPGRLSLEPCNLALGNIAWDPADALPSPTGRRGGGENRTAAQPTAAVLLGLGDDGKLQAMVDRSGRLRFDWSLAGRRDAADILGFLFEIPSAPANELSIELPNGVTPVINRGVVVGSQPAGKNARRWQIELGGIRRFRLRIQPAGSSGRRPQLALLRESTTYDFSLRGVEVSARWKLQVHNEPLSQVTVRLDPGLQLVSARSGDTSLSWSALPPTDGQGNRVVLALPEPIHDAEQVIRLTALGPSVLDRPWRLPRIHAEGLFWQEGTITLLAPEPLLINRIAPAGCAQTGTEALSAPRNGESLEFQAFQPDATVELSLARRPATLQVLSAAAIELGPQEASVRVAAEFQLAEGVRFVLEADMAAGWLIDTVESTPPNAVADWTLEPQPDGGQLLAIRLGAGLSPTKPLQLAITARRPFSPCRQKLGINDLSPLRFRDTAQSKQLIAMRAAAPYALALSGDEAIRQRRADSLTATERELLARSPQDLLFECDSRASRLEVALVAQKAKYAGTIEIDAALADGVLSESCLLRCVPQAGQVGRVLVQFFPRRETAPRWTLGAEDDRPLSARKWSNAEQAAAGFGDSVETWEVTLPHPRSAAFEITAVRSTAVQTAQPSGSAARAPLILTLASLPEAAGQRGIVAVRSLGAGPLHIENRRLTPIPPKSVPADRVQTVRGSYRFDPARDVADGAAAALRVCSHGSTEAGPPAWMWNGQLESRYQADGKAQHRATYGLQNSGVGQLGLTLPPGVARDDIRGVWIDGGQVAWRMTAAEAASRVTVQLPPDRRFSRLAIEWTASGPPLGIIGSLAPPLPEPDLPLLARCWTVWLPPEYDCLGADVSASSPGDSRLTWSQRLFGPLGRAESAERFDPLSAGDWMMPLVELRNRRQAAATPDAQGWTVWRTDFSAESPATLKFVHRDSMRLLELVVFLLVASAGCCKAVARPALLVALLGGFAAAAMVLPDVYAAIASSGVLGILFSLAWRWIHPRVAAVPAAPSGPEAAAPASPDPAVGSTVSRAAQVGLILLGVLLTPPAGDVTRGETPPQRTDQPAEEPLAGPPTYRVFVPIDADKKPAGDKVYVSETFYRELYRHAAAPADKLPGWLILRAVYRGVLAREAGSGRLGVDTLRTQYDLQVFGSAAKVRIPFRAEGTSLVPSGATLDGRPIDFDWDPDAAALTVEVAAAGQYRLELLLRPKERWDRSNLYGMPGVDPKLIGPFRQLGPVPVFPPGGFDVAIPPVAQSRLELTLPDGAPPVDVPSACGAVRVEKDPLRLVADLGPTDRLTVRWREGTILGTVGHAVDVEQLTWLKVQPGSLVVDTKFNLHVVEGQIQQVQLAVDRRLRLLPLPGDDPPTVQVGHALDQSRVITFHWPRPISDQVTLQATFLLGGATGVGNFRLPRIEMLDARTSKRWMAVSVDPTLDREEKRQRLEAVSIADFSKAWGPSDAKALAAYSLPGGEFDWTISTRPNEPRTAGDQTLTVSYGEDRVDMLFEAQVSTTSGYLFQHRLTAPEGWKIEEVSLLDGRVERASRWAQDADGTVTVFLNGPVSGQQKLRLRGWLPIQAGKSWPLPQVRLQRCQLRAAITRLFRWPTVSLTIHGGPKQAAAAPPSVDSATLDLGRFVAAFTGDGLQAQPVSVTVQRSRPDRLPQPPAASNPSASSAKVPPSRCGDVRPKHELSGSRGGVVRLADVTMAWHADGGCCGTTVFDIEPGGAAECPLRLPDGYELLQVSVEGMPVTPEAVGRHQWRFPLASQRLPQRVEVLVRGMLPNVDQPDRSRFEAPALGQWPVRQTLWTVIGPPWWAPGEPEAAAALSPWKHELLRLKSTAAVIESAAAVASSAPDETSRWRQPWARRFAASRTALERELATAGGDQDMADARREAKAIGQKNRDISDVAGESVTSSFAFSSPLLQPTVRCAFEGRADSLTLDCRQAEAGWLAPRFGAAAALVVLTCAAVIGLRRGTLAPMPERWPHAAGVVLGLAWWLWLVPSVLGLGIALASVLTASWRSVRAKK